MASFRNRWTAARSGRPSGHGAAATPRPRRPLTHSPTLGSFTPGRTSRQTNSQQVRLGGAGTAPIALEIKPDWRTTATAVGSVLSVLLVAAGLFYTNDANRKQQGLAMQQQAADRFRAATGQLGEEGGDKLSIRLGGIYALQQLMRDSPDDKAMVVEVLCAFIRTHAPRAESPSAVARSSPPDIRAALSVVPSVHIRSPREATWT
jgi:hypothetical protein